MVVNCDNEAVVNVLNYGRSRDLFLQAAMREVCYLAAVGGFEVRFSHISGESNRVPDWLSRWAYGGRYRAPFRDYIRGKNITRVRTSTHMLKFLHNW